MLTHNYLFTLYVIIIYLSYGWLQNFTYKRSIAIGLLCGLAALTRPTEVISILIPLFWNIGNYAGLKGRITALIHQYKKVIVMILCACVIGSFS